MELSLSGKFAARIALTAFFSTFATFLSISAQIVINELTSIPLTGEPEWVELFNRGTSTVALDSFWLHDAKTAIRLPQFSMPPGTYALLTRDTFALRETRNLPPKVILVECKLPSLNNTTDIVALRSRDSSLLDSAYYNMKWGKRGVSLERKRADSLAVSQLNWFASISPDSATAGELNSVTLIPRDARIKAILVPKREEALHIIAENYGLELIDSAQITAYLNSDGKGTTQNNLIAKTKVKNLAPGAIFDFVVPFSNLRDRTGRLPIIAVCATANDGRKKNDTMLYKAYIPNTIGGARINEIMFDPPPNCSDFIEIINITDAPLDLGDWSLHDKPGVNGADTLRFPAEFVIAPGDFAVIAADTGIFTQFPTLRGDSRVCISQNKSFNLNSDGDDVVLLDPNGNEADSLSYAAKWHSPALHITKGVSLEKISTNMPSELISAWSSSGSPAGGTPLQINSIAIEPSSSGYLGASPQPFIISGSAANSQCLLSYALPFRQTRLTLSIYTRTGQPVRSLLNSVYSAGEGSAAWDGRDESLEFVPTGVYVALLEAVDAASGEVRREKTAIVVGN